MPPHEAGVLAHVAAGDQEAMKELYATYRLRLWRYLWTQLDGRSDWAEDVMQDVFVEVWRTADNYRGEASVSTWLFRIAHHVASNARRSRMRRGESQQITLPSAGPEEGWLPESLRQDSCENTVVDHLALMDALQQLSSKHRDVIDLISYHGFSCEEAAHILSVPVGTVKSRLNYARRALAAALTADLRERRIV